MLTDLKSPSMRLALEQIYINLYVEYVVKNPLSPVEHPGGVGVNNELFEESLEQFVVSGLAVQWCFLCAISDNLIDSSIDLGLLFIMN